jgi:hypothetical protein
MSNRATIVSALLLAAAVGVGCHADRGVEKSQRLESRSKGEGSALGSADLVVASDKATAGIAAVPEIASATAAGGRTVVVMDRVENKTSDPSANFQIYLARIRVSLNQSGASRHLVFVESRAKAEGIKDREGVTESARIKPHFALTGTFYDLPRGRTNYHLLTFQLVDLTSDVVVWEDSYEVKL